MMCWRSRNVTWLNRLENLRAEHGDANFIRKRLGSAIKRDARNRIRRRQQPDVIDGQTRADKIVKAHPKVAGDEAEKKQLESHGDLTEPFLATGGKHRNGSTPWPKLSQRARDLWKRATAGRRMTSKSQYDLMRWEAMPMKIAEFQKLAAGLLLLVLAGCQTVTSEPVVIDKPIVETPQDSALSKLVRDRLHAEKKVDLTNIKVESSSGAVYLSGTVQSLDAREHAIKSAWEVRGVQSVINHLTVKN